MTPREGSNYRLQVFFKKLRRICGIIKTGYFKTLHSVTCNLTQKILIYFFQKFTLHRSFRSSTINNPEVDTRVEAMEAKLAELSKKFEQITTTPSSDEKSESDRRNSNKELSKVAHRNTVKS